MGTSYTGSPPVLNPLCMIFFSHLVAMVKMSTNREMLNVLLLGVAFMFILTPFQTIGLIEKVILDNIKSQDPSFNGDGFISLAIIYGLFAVVNWITPSLIVYVGSKNVMILGATTYISFVCSFLKPRTFLLYLASALLGSGAALLWTGQGNYLTSISTRQTMARNSGIFWAIMQCSFLFGNLLVFLKFSGSTHIDADSQYILFISLLASACLGWILLLILHSPQRNAADSGETSIWTAFKGSLNLLSTSDFRLLVVTFLYTGFELSFLSGVYSTCIGFTQSFGAEAHSLMGLAGIFVGFGNVLGGILFGLFGSVTNKYGRDPVILLGYLVHVCCFFLIFLILPNSSPAGATSEASYMTPNASVAMLCSFLLGLGDACFNTQIYSILGSIYTTDNASAFAIFKFTQSLGAAIAFLCSSYIGLYYQLLWLFILGTAGALCFWRVEMTQKKVQEVPNSKDGDLTRK